MLTATRIPHGFALYPFLHTHASVRLSRRLGGDDFACVAVRERLRDLVDEIAWIPLLLYLCGDVELNPGPAHFETGVPRYAQEEVAELVTQMHVDNVKKRIENAVQLSFNVSDQAVQHFTTKFGVSIQPDCTKTIRGHEYAAVLRELTEQYMARKLQGHQYLEIAPNFVEMREGHHYCTLLATCAKDRSRATIALLDMRESPLTEAIQLAMQGTNTDAICINGFQNCYYASRLGKAGMVHDLDPAQLPTVMRRHAMEVLYVSMYLPLGHTKEDPYHDEDLGISQSFAGDYVRFHFIGHDVHAYQHSSTTYYKWLEAAFTDGIDHVMLEAVYRIGPVAVIRCVRAQGLLNLSRPSDVGVKRVRLRLWVNTFEYLMNASQGYLFDLKPGTCYRRWLDNYLGTIEYVDLEEDHVRRMMEFILSREDQTYRRQSSHAYFKALSQRIRIGMTELQKGFNLPVDKLQAIYTQLFIVGSVWRQIDTQQTGIVIQGVSNRIRNSLNLPYQIYTLLFGTPRRPYHWVTTNVAELIVHLAKLQALPIDMHEYHGVTPIPKSTTTWRVAQTFEGEVTPPDDCIPKSISILEYGSEDYVELVKDKMLEQREECDTIASVTASYPDYVQKLKFEDGHCVPLLTIETHCRHSIGKTRDALFHSYTMFQETKFVKEDHVQYYDNLTVDNLTKMSFISKLRDPNHHFYFTIRKRRVYISRRTRITAVRYGVGVSFIPTKTLCENPIEDNFSVSPSVHFSTSAAANRNIVKFDRVAPLLEHFFARAGFSTSWLGAKLGVTGVNFARELIIQQPAIAMLCASPGNDLAYACERSNITTVCLANQLDSELVKSLARNSAINVVPDFNITCRECMKGIKEDVVYADLGCDSKSSRKIIATLHQALCRLIENGKTFVIKWQYGKVHLTEETPGTDLIIDLCENHHLTIFSIDDIHSNEVFITSRLTEYAPSEPDELALPIDHYRLKFKDEARPWYKWPLKTDDVPVEEEAVDAMDLLPPSNGSQLPVDSLDDYDWLQSTAVSRTQSMPILPTAPSRVDSIADLGPDYTGRYSLSNSPKLPSAPPALHLPNNPTTAEKCGIARHLEERLLPIVKQQLARPATPAPTPPPEPEKSTLLQEILVEIEYRRHLRGNLATGLLSAATSDQCVPPSSTDAPVQQPTIIAKQAKPCLFNMAGGLVTKGYQPNVYPDPELPQESAVDSEPLVLLSMLKALTELVKDDEWPEPPPPLDPPTPVLARSIKPSNVATPSSVAAAYVPKKFHLDTNHTGKALATLKPFSVKSKGPSLALPKPLSVRPKQLVIKPDVAIKEVVDAKQPKEAGRIEGPLKLVGSNKGFEARVAQALPTGKVELPVKLPQSVTKSVKLPKTTKGLRRKINPPKPAPVVDDSWVKALQTEAAYVTQENYLPFFTRFLKLSGDCDALLDHGFGFIIDRGNEILGDKGNYSVILTPEGMVVPKLPIVGTPGAIISNAQDFYKHCNRARNNNVCMAKTNDMIAVAIIATTAAAHGFRCELGAGNAGSCDACRTYKKVRETPAIPVPRNSNFSVTTDDISKLRKAATNDLQNLRFPGIGELAQQVQKKFAQEKIPAFSYAIKYVHGVAGCAKTSAIVETIDISQCCVTSPFKANLPEFTKGTKRPRKSWTFHAAYANYDGTIPLIIDEIACYHPYIAMSLIYRASEHGSEVIVLGDPKQGKQVDKQGHYKGASACDYYPSSYYYEASYSMLPEVCAWLNRLGHNFRTASTKVGNLHLHKPAAIVDVDRDYYCVTTQMALAKKGKKARWHTCTSAQGMRAKTMHIMLEEQGLALLVANNYALLYMILSRATEEVHVYITQNMERQLKYQPVPPHACTGNKFAGAKHIGQLPSGNPVIFTHTETTDISPLGTVEQTSDPSGKTLHALQDFQKRPRRSANSSSNRAKQGWTQVRSRRGGKLKGAH